MIPVVRRLALKGRFAMTRKILLAQVVIILGALAPAVEQYEDEGPSKIGIRLFALSPMGSRLRDTQAIWLGPMIDYHLERDEEGRPNSYASIALVSASADV